MGVLRKKLERRGLEAQIRSCQTRSGTQPWLQQCLWKNDVSSSYWLIKQSFHFTDLTISPCQKLHVPFYLILHFEDHHCLVDRQRDREVERDRETERSHFFFFLLFWSVTRAEHTGFSGGSDSLFVVWKSIQTSTSKSYHNAKHIKKKHKNHGCNEESSLWKWTKTVNFTEKP